MASLTAAIMQPTYLPWLGYMALMKRVDTFVILDSVQFDKRSWQQRNRIKTANGVQWLTVPVLSKGKREQSIAEVEVDASSGFARKHVAAMTHAYKKCPHFDLVAGRLFPVYEREHTRLVDLNLELLSVQAELLGVGTPVVRSSSLGGEGSKADLLVSLCREVGAGRYVSPPGARVYLEETDAFERAGIELRYHQYEPRQYAQPNGAFEPYMSCVDALFNLGPEAASQLVL